MANNSKIKNDISAVYGKYSDMLYRIAFMQLGNSEDAMDCVQDTFIRYMTADVLFSSDEHEKAWFIRTAVNACHDLYRKNRIRDHEELSAAEQIPYSEHFSEESYRIAHALEQIPEKLKTVIILHYLEGYSVEETGAMLKIGRSAVKMRLARGRDALKSILEKEEFDV